MTRDRSPASAASAFRAPRPTAGIAEELANFALGPLPIVGGAWLRGIVYRRLFRRCGRGLFKTPHVRIIHGSRITIGERCGLSYGAMLDGVGGISIGDDFNAGPGAVIDSGSDVPFHARGADDESASIVIGNDVWCGARAVILPGVRIADGTVIAACSVVTRDTEACSVVAGNPARAVYSRSEFVAARHQAV